MSDTVPEAFRGLDRFEARKAVVAALEAEGLLAGTQVHNHAVPRCYRCQTVVEPRLSKQWFVKMKPLAEPALAASRDGTVTFTPERWKKVYEHWLENIRDWCISRQLWWGHRIPVWYCAGCGETIVARDDQTACPECGSDEIAQDPDVLDTWFSSWLWPFSTFGWPERTDDLKGFLPRPHVGHCPRDPVLLGGPHDHVGHRIHGGCALHAGLFDRHGEGRSGQEDVEVTRQRDRPARGGGALRRRCHALLPS